MGCACSDAHCIVLFGHGIVCIALSLRCCARRAIHHWLPRWGPTSPVHQTRSKLVRTGGPKYDANPVVVALSRPVVSGQGRR
eukprot:9477264-Pyramimonas_sp.AAC.1